LTFQISESTLADVAKRKQVEHGGAREGAGRPPLAEETADLTVRFPKDVLDVLAALAADREQSVGALVREAVAQYVARKRR